MTKKEQIEQMEKERIEIKAIMKLLDRCGSLNPMCKADVATIIYGNNYRKIPEGSVVLTEEEAERFRGQTINIAKIKAQARKDTAKEICDLILEHWQGHDLVECDWLIVAISEKYGVDMK